MKSILKSYLFFILIHLTFCLPVVISSISIAAQVKASLSVSELLGVTKESYSITDRFALKDKNIIDVFTEGDTFMYDILAEQQRAILRDYLFPHPIYFYVPIVIILIYLVVNTLMQKHLSKPFLWRISPILMVALASAFTVAAYSDNYILPLSFFNIVS